VREKKSLQFGVRFEDSLARGLKKVSRQTKLPMAEIVRLCVARQLDQIRRDGGINLSVDMESD
jgi:hypothetical protein